MSATSRTLPFANAMNWLIGHRQLLLVLMFGLLHIRLMQFMPAPYDRVPMVLHFALFLLWQPFVNTQSNVGAPHLVWIAAGVAMTLFDLTWALLALWLVLIAGIVGGRVFYFSRSATKTYYLMALGYLIVMLLFQVIPHIIPSAVEGASLISALAGYGAPVLLVVMAFLPESKEADDQRETIDLVFSLFIILMLSVLVLGSTSLMLLRQTGYIQSLLTAIFVASGILLSASWLWNPVAGFSRLGTITSRYMLSIGLPFEQWLRSLAELAEVEGDPDRFLDRACQSLVEQLPWVNACTWSTADPGTATKATSSSGAIDTVFRQGDVSLILTTEQDLPPVVVWHFTLVTQLVARFYAAKKGDRQLREMAYMQAIHETGARLTHDVKNLLQSMNALLFVVEESETNPKAQPLLRRQLPLMAQRLQQTLGKLQEPEAAPEETQSATEWWRELRSRYEGRNINFELEGNAETALLHGLFTSAAENLLQNALDKRAIEPGIIISLLLDLRGSLPLMQVRDSGSPLPPERERDVFRRPLQSENGLGIGLYQLARLAAASQYKLDLSANQAGDVCFQLRPEAAAP